MQKEFVTLPVTYQEGTVSKCVCHSHLVIGLIPAACPHKHGDIRVVRMVLQGRHHDTIAKLTDLQGKKLSNSTGQLLLQQLLVMPHTLTSSGVFLLTGVGSFTRWGTGSDRGTVATAADAQRWERRKQVDQAFSCNHA